MKRTELIREARKMKFEELDDSWEGRSLTREEAASILGESSRTFRRHVDRYEEEGLAGLRDRPLGGLSSRRASVDEVLEIVDRYEEKGLAELRDRPSGGGPPRPRPRTSVDEVMEITDKYRSRHEGWAVRHFYVCYRAEGGLRSYSWVKDRLQEAGLVKKAPGRGRCRKRRLRAAWPGMALHQDASRHEWVEGKYWDLVVTMDDATNEHYSMFFTAEEGTASSLAGVREVVEKRGFFSRLYTDRASHYWNTPEAGGKADRENLTRFGEAMKRLGIVMMPAYSLRARGRLEKMFSTHRSRLPKELAMAGITEMEEANRYLRERYLPEFNKKFQEPTLDEGSAFVRYAGGDLADVLCERHERVVGGDNCVSFEGLKLRIPEDRLRPHRVRVRIGVHRYPDGRLAVFHGPRLLARYEADGRLVEPVEPGKARFGAGDAGRTGRRGSGSGPRPLRSHSKT